MECRKGQYQDAVNHRKTVDGSSDVPWKPGMDAENQTRAWIHMAIVTRKFRLIFGCDSQSSYTYGEGD